MYSNSKKLRTYLKHIIEADPILPARIRYKKYIDLNKDFFINIFGLEDYEKIIEHLNDDNAKLDGLDYAFLMLASRQIGEEDQGFFNDYYLYFFNSDIINRKSVIILLNGLYKARSFETMANVIKDAFLKRKIQLEELFEYINKLDCAGAYNETAYLIKSMFNKITTYIPNKHPDILLELFNILITEYNKANILGTEKTFVDLIKILYVFKQISKDTLIKFTSIFRYSDNLLSQVGLFAATLYRSGKINDNEYMDFISSLYSSGIIKNNYLLFDFTYTINNDFLSRLTVNFTKNKQYDKTIYVINNILRIDFNNTIHKHSFLYSHLNSSQHIIENKTKFEEIWNLYSQLVYAYYKTNNMHKIKQQNNTDASNQIIIEHLIKLNLFEEAIDFSIFQCSKNKLNKKSCEKYLKICLDKIPINKKIIYCKIFKKIEKDLENKKTNLL